MEAVFLKLLNMSISASWLVLAVIGLRLVLKKAPKALRCVLWGLVAVRLVCPFSFESTLSLIPSTETVPQDILTASAPSALSGGVEDYALESERFLYFTAPAADGTTEITGPAISAVTVQSWLAFASVAWLIGALVLLGYALFSYLRLRRKVGASIDLGTGVFLCDYIDTPFILGVIKPKIYLPSSLAPEDASYVLAHERAHLKRRDHWWKPLGFALLTLHWFNPLLWLAYCLLCRDIELACDERVVRDMEASDKKAYSEALLKCSVSRHTIAACPLAFGEVGVKERVKNVLNYRKPAFWITIAAVIALIGAAVCFLTDPQIPTLADFQQLDTQSIVRVDIQSSKGAVCLSTQKELAAILKVLQETKYDADPTSNARIEDIVDEYGWLYPYVKITNAEGEYTFYFTYDYAQVWGNDGVKPTNPYSVANPSVIREFVQAYAEPFMNHTITPDPFASLDTPWEWTQNIHTGAVEQVRMYDSNGNATHISSAYVEECFRILNGLSQDAIVKDRFIENFSYSDLRYGTAALDGTAGLSLAVTDGANDLTGIIRICGDALELILLEGTQWLSSNWPASETGIAVQVWTIRDSQLLSFMQELSEHPPAVFTWLGSFLEVERIPAVVSYGNISITTGRLSDWDYEIMEYTEGAESFGIRCRPKDADEGWLYFSFWPEGYDPAEEDRYYLTSSVNGYPEVTSYPAAAGHGSFNSSDYAWSYSKVEYPAGDYAVINDGADAWFQEYRKYVNYAQILTTFAYDTADESGENSSLTKRNLS